MTVVDLVIADFAAENVELRERVLLGELFREALSVALGQLAERNAEVERLRRHVAALCDENRRLREREAVAA